MYDASPWFRLTLCVLAVWRVSHLVAHEDGPFDVVVRLRALAGNGMLGRLMDCPYCLSLWLAAPAALLLANRLPDWSMAWLAISGGASLVEKLWRSAYERRKTTNPTTLSLDGADENAMLWTETRNDDQSEPTRAHGSRQQPLDPHT